MAIKSRRKVANLKKISDAPLHLLRGQQGADGKDGIGRDGERGVPGLPGRDGQDGKDANPYEVAEILKKDAEFIEATKGDKGADGQVVEGGGLVSGVKYTQISTAEYKIPSSKLIPGINIFGVIVSPCDVYLPRQVHQHKVITINDETGLGGIRIIQED